MKSTNNPWEERLSYACVFVGTLYFLLEIYYFLTYSLDARHLPRFLYFPSNHLNLGIMLLSCWLVLFGLLWKRKNEKALVISASLFVGFWICYFILRSNYGTLHFSYGYLFFYLPQKLFGRIPFLIGLALSLWFLGKAIRSRLPEPGAFLEDDRPISRMSYVAIFFVITLSVLIRFINIDIPLLEYHEWRQTQTAITVWTFVTEGISFLSYQTPIFGPPWRAPYEFPIFQATAALFIKGGISNIDVACRVTGILYFFLSAAFLFLLCEQYVNSRRMSISILLFYLWSPYMIFWSRTSMIDYASVAFALAYFYFLTLWLRESKNVFFLISTIIFGSLAYLTKITTMFALVIPIGYFILMHLSDRTGRGPSEKNIVRDLLEFAARHKLFVAGLCGAIFIPFLAGYIWVLYRDSIITASPWTLGLSSKNLRMWHYAHLSDRLDLRIYKIILNRVTDYIAPYISLLFVPIGLWYVNGYSRRSSAFVYGILLSALFTILVLFNLYWWHDYYLMAVTPAIAIVVGVGIYHFFFHMFKKNRVVKVACAILIPLSFLSEKPLGYILQAYGNYKEEIFLVGKFVKEITRENEYVVVADSNWNPAILYYSKRKGFMLIHHEGGKRINDYYVNRNGYVLGHFENDICNKFLKSHNFSVIVCKKEHPFLFSNWRNCSKIGEFSEYKIYKVDDEEVLSKSRPASGGS